MNLPDPILRVTDAIRTANAETGFTYFTPVADDPEVWTLCSRGVGPVFVPLVAQGSNPLGLHIQPGVPLADQHLATFYHESHGLCMMGRGLDRLLICLYLANKYTFHNWGESSQFLAWLEAVRAAAPTLLLGVPSELHTPALAAMTGSSWEPWGGEGADPYRHAQNPLVGLAGCPDMFDETEALAQLEALADVDGADAHICALRAVLAAGNGRTLTAAQYMTWLPRESWYFLADFGCVGYYLPSAAAPAWHGVLRYGFPEVLRGTPFAPLERCPNAFNDKAGVPILIEIADTYRDLGDRERELGTLRNAATVSLVTTHRYPAGLLERIASVCEAIEPGGFAGQVTLEYIEARKRRP